MTADIPTWTVIGLRSDVTGELVVAAVVDGSVLPRDTTGSAGPDWSRWTGLYQAPTADQAALLAEADHTDADD